MRANPARASVAALAIACSASFALPADAGFFPSRPKGARTFALIGVLTGWSHGEGVGGIEVRDARGVVHRFYMGYPAKIDGKFVRCFEAPTKEFPAPPMCADWPKNVAIGRTKVKVIYWNAKLGEKSVLAADRVDTQ